jgi:hypothetical protein
VQASAATAASDTTTERSARADGEAVDGVGAQPFGSSSAAAV